MKQNIWLVIITYNPNILILRELIKVFEQTNILIVDNSPNHQTVNSLSVNKILNSENKGFSAAVNQGLNYVKDRNGEWIIVANQDIDLKRTDFNLLSEKLDKTTASIIGPIAGTLDRNRWTTILDQSVSNKFEYITASLVAIRLAILDQVGYFEEKYFMYYEDVDFCIRATRKGFSMEQVSLRTFKHKESSVIGKNSIRHNYYLTRNHLLFIERLAPIRVILYEIVRLPKSFFEFLSQHNTGALYGLRDYFFRSFGVFVYET